MTSSDLNDRRIRAAQNQSFFREVNGRIDDLSTRWGTQAEYICECLDTQCNRPIFLTPEEYHDIRNDPNCFFVVDGHEFAEIEETVGRTDRYLVVRKIGAGAEEAVEQAQRAARPVAAVDA